MTTSVEHFPSWRAGGTSRAGRYWTPAEDALLRFEWGATPLWVIARRLGRTRRAVHARATEVLRLRRGCPEGHETLTEAARRTGFDPDVMRNILEAHGVEIAVQSSVGARARHGRRKRFAVDPLEVDAAVEAWCASETPEQAAKRHGVSAPTMRRWLEQAGHAPTRPRAPWRVPTRVIDEVVAARSELETPTSAAKRHGISDSALRKWLLDAGHEPPAKCAVWRLPPSVMDEIAAAWSESETPRGAAKRYGISPHTLRKWLREAGHEPARERMHWRVPTRVIDQVVAARKATQRGETEVVQ